MPKPYAPPYPFVEVIWDDATSENTAWLEVSDVPAPEQVMTRGFLVKETDKYVVVAASVANEEVDTETVGNMMTIPKGMIVSRRELRLSTAKPKKPKAPQP